MKRGDKVRFTSESLGVLDPENLYRFRGDWHVGPEDVGTYLAPDPSGEKQDWHSVEVERDGETGIVPVHESMFEVIE